MTWNQTRRPSPMAGVGLALGALLILVYLPVVLLGETFVLRDHVLLNLPARHVLADALRAGRIPQWWNGVGLGIPFAANPMYGVFYPPFWLVALLPAAWAADLLCVLHLWFLGLGTAALAGRWGAKTEGMALAGGLAALCGYCGSMVENGVPLFGTAWIPWALFFGLGLLEHRGRRTTLLLMAALSLMTAAGDPACVISTGATLALFGLADPKSRRRIPLLLVAGVGGAALAAIIIVPAWYLYLDSARASGLTAGDATTWSMHPLRLVEWVLPWALGTPTAPGLGSLWARSAADASLGYGWSTSLFFGLPPLLLAAFGAQRRGLMGTVPVILVLLLLALGGFTPIYGLYRALFPPEGMIRYPERHLAPLFIVLSALAGSGLRDLRHAGPPEWKRSAAVVACIASIVAILTWSFASPIVAKLANSAPPGFPSQSAWMQVVGGGAIMAAATACFWLGACLRSPTQRRVLIHGAILAPLIWHGWALHPTVPRQGLATPPALLQAHLGGAEGLRLYRHRSAQPMVPAGVDPMVALHHTGVANTGARFGVRYFPGYDPAASGAFEQTWAAAAAANALRLLPRYGVGHGILRRQEARQLQILNQTAAGALVLARLPNPRPRAFATSSWQDAATHGAALQALPALHRDAVVIEGSPPGPGTALTPIQPCTLAPNPPEVITMTCTSAAPGYAVVLDAWAAGWTAAVDGLQTPILRADGLVRAVALGPGKHTVVMRYTTPGRTVGFVVTLCAALLWILGWRRFET